MHKVRLQKKQNAKLLNFFVLYDVAVALVTISDLFNKLCQDERRELSPAVLLLPVNTLRGSEFPTNGQAWGWKERFELVAGTIDLLLFFPEKNKYGCYFRLHVESPIAPRTPEIA